MGQLDASIVTVALPTLQRTFGVSVGAVTWVGLSYLLVLVATVIAVGRFADMWGRKLLYVYGFVHLHFGVGAVRPRPGPGGAVRVPGAAGRRRGDVAGEQPGHHRAGRAGRSLGRAIGLQGTAQALGLALGPTIGGLLLAAGGWRLIFFVNVPFGLFGAVAAVLLVPRSRNLMARVRFDWTGLGIFFPAVVALVSAISFGAALGWSSALIIGLFARRRRFWSCCSSGTSGGTATPCSTSGCSATPASRRGSSAESAPTWCMFGVLLLIPFYLERGLGFGAARAGLELMAMPLAFGVVAPLAGRLADRARCPAPHRGRDGARRRGPGPAGCHPALDPLVPRPARRDRGRPGALHLAQQRLHHGRRAGQQAGMASGVLNMSRGMGTALGLAVTGTIFVVAGGDGGGDGAVRSTPSPSRRTSWRPSPPRAGARLRAAGQRDPGRRHTVLGRSTIGPGDFAPTDQAARPFSSRCRGCRTSPRRTFPGDGPDDHTAGVSARCRRCGWALQRAESPRCGPRRSLPDPRLDRRAHRRAAWARPDRREAFRDEGATSTEAWAVERFGVSAPTARA